MQSKEQMFAEKLRRQLCDLVEQLEAFKADRSQLQLHVELLQVRTAVGAEAGSQGVWEVA